MHLPTSSHVLALSIAVLMAGPPVLNAAVTRFEETGATYTGTWFPNGAAVHTASRALIAVDAGSAATFSFSGTGVTWIGYADEWAGIARVFVDGALRASVDTYSSPHQAQKPLFTATGLSAGPHTLRIEATGTRNAASGGVGVWVDAFDVDSGAGPTSTPTPVTRPTPTPTPTATAAPTPTPTSAPRPTATPASGTQRIEDGDPRVVYAGTWHVNTSPNANHSGGAAHVTGDTGPTATLAFDGTGVRWWGLRDPWAGIARVYIDGGLRATVDTYSAAQQVNQVLFSVDDLAAGSHTIRVEVTGQRNVNSGDELVWVDAFDVVSGGTPTATPTPRPTATPTTPPSPTPTPTAPGTPTPTPTPGITPTPNAWQCFSPRPELKPACTVDTAVFRSAPDSLAISGAGNAAVYGGWVRTFAVSGGQGYELAAYYQAAGISDPMRKVIARVDWLDGSGARVGLPAYAHKLSADGPWQRLTMNAPAPAGATQARVELLLGWDADGVVRWDDVTFLPAPLPPDRTVRIGTVAYRPTGAGGKEGNVNEVLAVLDQIGPSAPDIVVLCEGIPRVGNGLASADSLAETIPGPITDQFAAKARQYGMYVAAAIYERDGDVIYNTAFLLDRAGNLVGKYRKVYLPFEEVEYGLSPGDGYPVVLQTDFGKVALFICWDAQYSDVARAMAAQGAEILLLPTWGGDFAVMKARAAENHVHLVTSGYDVETAIVDPSGTVLYSVPRATSNAVTNVMPITLRDSVVKPDLGDMRARIHKELRWDVPDPAGVR